jgi:hypothetical protein
MRTATLKFLTADACSGTGETRKATIDSGPATTVRDSRPASSSVAVSLPQLRVCVSIGGRLAAGLDEHPPDTRSTAARPFATHVTSPIHRRRA